MLQTGALRIDSSLDRPAKQLHSESVKLQASAVHMVRAHHATGEATVDKHHCKSTVSFSIPLGTAQNLQFLQVLWYFAGHLLARSQTSYVWYVGLWYRREAVASLAVSTGNEWSEYVVVEEYRLASCYPSMALDLVAIMWRFYIEHRHISKKALSRLSWNT